MRRYRPALIMAWILLFVWIAWAFQPDNGGTQPVPASEAPNPDGQSAPKPGATQPEELAGDRTERAEVAGPSGQDTPAGPETAEVVPLRALPKRYFRTVRNRLASINQALEADGLAPLPESQAAISVDNAEQMLRSYEAIRATQRPYDKMLEERMQSLLDSHGAGTGVLEVGDWDRVSAGRIKQALAAKHGEEALRGSDTVLRWNAPTDGRLRYGIFKPGTDKALDEIRARYEQHYSTTVRRAIIRLVDHFEKRN